jgi:hypothetical protein
VLAYPGQEDTEKRVMTNYQIQPITRRCAATNKELPPGSKFYTVLFDRDGKFVREDYSSEAWQGPPPGAFSFWSGRVPVPAQSRQPGMDDEMLLDCFVRLHGETESGRINFRFVLALLLMRRKRLKFEQVRRDGDLEFLQLRCARSGVRHDVLNPRLGEEEMAAVQEEVFKVLGWE